MNDQLKGKSAITTGSTSGIGLGIAFRELGTDLAITYLNDKAKPYVEPLAQGFLAPLFLPLDFAQPGSLEAVFQRITQTWGGWTSWSTPRPSSPRTTFKAVCSIALPRASPKRWIFPAIRSFAWPGWPCR